MRLGPDSITIKTTDLNQNDTSPTALLFEKFISDDNLPLESPLVEIADLLLELIVSSVSVESRELSIFC